MKKRYFGLQWHITDNCDQRCQHCYIFSKESNYKCDVGPNLAQANAIIENFLNFCYQKSCVPSFTITGGDPILHPDFWGILEQLHLKKIRFKILGNPFHLNQRTLSEMKNLGLISYQVSIDGEQKTHDSFRKEGSFEKTVESLDLMYRCGVRSVVMSTVSSANYHEIPTIAKLCVEHHVSHYAFARYCPTHQDTNWNIPPLEYRSFLEIMWGLYKDLADEGTTFALKDHLFTPLLYEKGLLELPDTHGLIHDGCGCAIRHMTLLPNGDIFACRRFDSKIGNIYEKSFSDAFSSKTCDKYRQFDDLKKCRSCKLLNYCRGCHAVSAGSTGNFFDEDPQCWFQNNTMQDK